MPTEILTPTFPDGVRRARLRLAQRLLIGAASADRCLLTDEHWQEALSHVTAILETDATDVPIQMDELRKVPL